MKKSPEVVRLASVTLLAVMVSGCSFKDFFEARFQAQMVQASAENNKRLPKMIDEETRLDTTVVGPGKQWTYLYTLVNYGPTDTNNEQINEILGAKIRKAFCSTKEMQLFIEHDVVMKYKYRAKDGSDLGEVVVTASDCGKHERRAKKPD